MIQALADITGKLWAMKGRNAQELSADVYEESEIQRSQTYGQ